MSSPLNIRRATLQDYQGVMDIGKIYKGRDYLPAKYKQYLDQFNCYVCEIDGVIVAFVADRLIDGGTAIATSAARVKDGYQGRGILAAMLKNVYDSYKDNEAVMYEVMTTNSFNLAENSEKLTKKYEIVTERHYLEYIAEVNDFDPTSVPEPEANHAPTELTTTDLEDIMNSDEMRSRLFPNGCLLPNWYPFRAMIENIPLIMETVRIFGTKDACGRFSTLTTIDTFPIDSFQALKVVVCVYGLVTADACKHVYKHLQLVCEQLKGGDYKYVTLHVTYDLDSQCPDDYISTLKKCGFTEDTVVTSKRMIYMRRKL